MENGGIFYGHLQYFKAIWYIYGHLAMLWYILPVLVYCAKKNLATLSKVDATVCGKKSKYSHFGGKTLDDVILFAG
jgi:hypothetical protein